jgi:hypothetical protein
MHRRRSVTNDEDANAAYISCSRTVQLMVQRWHSCGGVRR